MGLKKKSKGQKEKDAGAMVEKDGMNRDKKRVITDDRFSKVHSDPRFQNVPGHKAKVAIDSRFNAMFTDKRFATSSAASRDKRGKRKNDSSDKALRRYYRLEEEEGKKKEEGKREGRINEEESDDMVGVSSDSESGDELHLSKLTDDDGEEEIDDDGVDVDSDASTSTTDTDEEGDAYIEDDASAEVENVPVIEKETHRLAIVNMDWSQVKAADLFVMLSSFLPKGGQLSSVSVYPSEFGLKRMEEEAVHGPTALFGAKDENGDSDSDDGDDEIDNEKLRDYERSRLRYYYAVVVCDSVATADYLYKSCDGAEFERSSNRLDMRFIPDDMEFKHPPRDQAAEAPADYEGLDFQTRALQQSNVHLSWDDDEPHRVKTLKRNFNADQLADLELKEFLASDVSESEEDGENTEDLSEKKNKKLDKYRALLQSGEGSEEEEEAELQDMEVTFNTGLEDISKKILERKDTKSETVWEKNLRTKKEKKKARKNRSKQSSDDESDYSDREPVGEADDFFEEEQPQAKRSRKTNGSRKEAKDEALETEGAASQAELELLLADDSHVEKNKKGYKIKPEKGKQKKKRGKNEAPVEDKLPEVDLNDPRFAALHTNPLFAQDPTHPEWKRSVSYARQEATLKKNQKKKGRDQILNEEDEGKNLVSKSDVTTTTKKDKHELSMLVKSVKMKSKQAPVSLHNGKMDSPGEKKKRKRKANA